MTEIRIMANRRWLVPSNNMPEIGATKTELLNKKQSESKETKDITFKCKYCGKTWPLDDMRTLSRFFPPVVACRECEKKMR